MGGGGWQLVGWDRGVDLKLILSNDPLNHDMPVASDDHDKLMDHIFCHLQTI